MGIYNRDYYRTDDRERIRDNFSGTMMTRGIIVVCLIVFLGCAASDKVAEALSLTWSGLASGQIWRVITYGFCHQDVMHFVFNMLALYFFGSYFEETRGSREMLVLFLLGVVISGLGELALYFAFPPYRLNSGDIPPAIRELLMQEGPRIIGASGGLMTILFAVATMYPRMTVIFYFVRMELRWLAAIYIFIDLFGFLESHKRGMSRVAHIAHLSGALLGFLYVKFGWHLVNLNSRLWKFSPRKWLRFKTTSLRVVRPEDDPPSQKPLDQQIDAILAKLHEQGEASLTPQEREILIEGSKRFKTRMKL